jgi:hypothetical protein
LLCAVFAVGLGLLTVALKDVKPYSSMLAVGAAIALILSLTFGVFAAAGSFSDGGRPTITNVSVTAEGDTHAVLSFTVMASGVKSDNLLRASAIWVRDATGLPPGRVPPQEPPFYTTTLRPDDKGVVNQEVTILLARLSPTRRIRIQVRWDKEASSRPTSSAPTSTPEATSTSEADSTSERATPGTTPSAATTGSTRKPPAAGADCGDQDDAAEASACVEIVVAAASPASPTVTSSSA